MAAKEIATKDPITAPVEECLLLDVGLPIFGLADWGIC